MINHIEKNVAVITGGGGLGMAIAGSFLKRGFKVVVLSRTDKRVYPSQEDLRPYRFLACDITDSVETTKAVSDVVKTFGRLDVAVHTAVSKLASKKSFDLSPEDFQRSFLVDVFGGFNFLHAVAKQMKEQKHGSIVAISSSYTEAGSQNPPLISYISAKFALRGMLREFAKELAAYGVRVNAVAPSFVPTGLNAGVPERMLEFLKEKNPMQAMVSPEDVAAVVDFLCSDAAKSLTGLHIPIAFGEAMNL
jgi:3-oxoacyl-[acyl-carrier protein] reductase